MSIETEITRISTNVSDTLSAISEMGGEVPEGAKSDDMASGVRSIPVGAKINDTTPSSTTTYSSSKIESEISKLNEALVDLQKDVGVKKDISLTIPSSSKGSATSYYYDLSSTELKSGRLLSFKLSEYSGNNFQLYKVFLLDSSGSYTQLIINGTGSFSKDTDFSYEIDSLKEYCVIRFYVQTTATEAENPTWKETVVIRKDGEIKAEINGIKDNISSPLKDLKIGFLGDSFTAPTNFYGSLIADKTGCIVYNYGLGGSRYYNHQNYTSGGVEYDVPAFWERVKNMDSNLDVVCTMGGINDANNTTIFTTKLGSISDEALTQSEIDNGSIASTFYQGCKTTIELLLTKYPNAKIMMVMPPHVLDVSYNPTMNAYDGIEIIINAEKEIAKHYGIPVLNLYENCTELNNFSGNVSRYRQAMNNIHPNTNGQKAMAHYFENALEQLVKNDYLT